MARKHHKPEEIIGKLRQVGVLVGQGKPMAETTKATGVTESTDYRWRVEYGDLKLNQVRRLEENGRLRRVVSDLMLEKLILNEAVSGDSIARPLAARVSTSLDDNGLH